VERVLPITKEKGRKAQSENKKKWFKSLVAKVVGQAQPCRNGADFAGYFPPTATPPEILSLTTGTSIEVDTAARALATDARARTMPDLLNVEYRRP
jgi:hypothetical protein